VSAKEKIIVAGMWLGCAGWGSGALQASIKGLGDSWIPWMICYVQAILTLAVSYVFWSESERRTEGGHQ
jgi:hypothetical protein